MWSRFFIFTVPKLRECEVIRGELWFTNYYKDFIKKTFNVKAYWIQLISLSLYSSGWASTVKDLKVF